MIIPLCYMRRMGELIKKNNKLLDDKEFKKDIGKVYNYVDDDTNSDQI